MSTEAEIYTYCPQFIQERCKHQRKQGKILTDFSFHIVSMIGIVKDSPYLIEEVVRQIDYILSDCEIYHGMTTDLAMDATSELSNWAALFVFKPKYSHIYARICQLLKTLQTSY